MVAFSLIKFEKTGACGGGKGGIRGSISEEDTEAPSQDSNPHP